jgi:hypothetical protein
MRKERRELAEYHDQQRLRLYSQGTAAGVFLAGIIWYLFFT